jgi:alkanesulfonate monooxygenase SsuD/methylene tetrahydromethanopterin reductase-like flavin-dependent oxidoreductase (luciferase family)
MKQMQIYAFDMNCVGHINHGMWTHPRDTSLHYTDLDYWTDLARTAERGKLDGIFLADIVGVYDVYKGSPESVIEAGAQIPVNDPLMPISAMAMSPGTLASALPSTPPMSRRSCWPVAYRRWIT